MTGSLLNWRRLEHCVQLHYVCIVHLFLAKSSTSVSIATGWKLCTIISYMGVQGFARSVQHCIRPQGSVTSLYGRLGAQCLPYKDVTELWGLIQCCKGSAKPCNGSYPPSASMGFRYKIASWFTKCQTVSFSIILRHKLTSDFHRAGVQKHYLMCWYWLTRKCPFQHINSSPLVHSLAHRNSCTTGVSRAKGSRKAAP